MTVQNSQSTTTEYIKISNTSEVNNNKTIINLKTPLIISVTKTPVYVYYPIVYIQDYNSNPKEVKIASSILSCDDDWNSKSPTCGFQYSNNTKVFDSQGFCCSCGLLDLIGLSDEYSRGNICKAASISSATMAFCLRYSTLWYSAFSIGSYSYTYNITVQIIYGDGSNETLQLGSDKSVASSTGLIVRIIGDFTPLQTPPALNALTLMKPSRPVTDIRVQQGSQAYMFIPNTAIGTGECNKIGVSYTAFRSDSNRCAKQVGSCIANQIEDLYQQDQQRISNGSQPKYIIAGYGQFTQITNGKETYLRYNVQGSMSTLITLEIETQGRISFVTNVGNGKIDYAEVNDFDSQSGNGVLVAQFTNIGEISSEFSTYLNCSINVIPLNAQSIFLDPWQSQQINKKINVKSDIAKNNTCNMSLINNVGTLLDFKVIQFTTQDIQYNSTQEIDEQHYTDKEVDAEQQSIDQCDTDCNGFFDITCYILNDCNAQITRFFGVLGAVVFILICCIILIKYRKTICCCCGNDKQSIRSMRQYRPQVQQLNDSSSYLQSRFIQQPSTRIMYMNITQGIDPIANHLQSDISVEVLVKFIGQQLIKINVRKSSQFVQIFKDVYGIENDWQIPKYLENIKEQTMQFPTLLTKYPTFNIL